MSARIFAADERECASRTSGREKTKLHKSIEIMRNIPLPYPENHLDCNPFKHINHKTTWKGSVKK